MNKKGTSYDEIPYPSIPFPESHPERLCAVARLFGLDAPAPAEARVLELGCSMGGNLIAISQINPGARCVGIDASATQIAEGWKTVEALGLKNVQLRHLDILDIDDSIGEFDYIISHGVYSWVPAHIQEKMLQICNRHLARNGIAYISYNTYPGWHIRGIVRDMMFYRGMQFSDAQARLEQAKSLVDFVAHASPNAETPYQQLLQGEFRQFGRMSDYYLHHEFLEEHNQPVYFHEFAQRLAVNGLQYLGEADFSTMISSNFSPEVAKTLHGLGAHDILQMEQYMDFVRCRYFRKTLICRSSIELQRAIDSSVVQNLLLASDAVPATQEPALDPSQRIAYEATGGGKLTCRAPLTKLALRALRREWPMPIAFADLLAESLAQAAQQGYPLDEAGAASTLSGDLLTGIGAGVVEWRVTPVVYTTSPVSEPSTSPWARLQAAQGYKVTNLRGEMITLDEIHRQTLRHLDGTRSLADLTTILVQALQAGEFVLHPENEKTVITEEAQMRKLLDSALGKVLENLARQAFIAAHAA
ncbi:MAG: class I SAM-dependent methyltransferase [Betaproteobacteria bacterium]|jgi:methyltransferase-like protein/SAM-dependent methyltransferase